VFTDGKKASHDILPVNSVHLADVARKCAVVSTCRPTPSVHLITLTFDIRECLPCNIFQF